jgi:hypothetical protein
MGVNEELSAVTQILRQNNTPPAPSTLIGNWVSLSRYNWGCHYSILVTFLQCFSTFFCCGGLPPMQKSIRIGQLLLPNLVAASLQLHFNRLAKSLTAFCKRSAYLAPAKISLRTTGASPWKPPLQPHFSALAQASWLPVKTLLPPTLLLGCQLSTHSAHSLVPPKAIAIVAPLTRWPFSADGG